MEYDILKIEGVAPRVECVWKCLMRSEVNSEYALIDVNLSDLTRRPTVLLSSNAMHDLRIESLSLSEKADRRVHSSLIFCL